MFRQISMDDDLGSALDSLRELEQSVDESILRRRSSERIKIATRVDVQHANSSERDALHIEGLSGDISNGGCQLLLPRPILAGDIFWLDFTVGEAASLGTLFARCQRCRLISEGSFEAGFRFFTNLDLEGVGDINPS